MVCKFPFIFLHQSLSCGFTLPHDDFGLEIHLHNSGLESFRRGNPIPNTPRILTKEPDSSPRSLQHQSFLVMLRELLKSRKRKGYEPNPSDNTAVYIFREIMKDVLSKIGDVYKVEPDQYTGKGPFPKCVTDTDLQFFKNDITKILEDGGSLSAFLLCSDLLTSIFPQFSQNYLFTTCFGEDLELMEARKYVMNGIQKMLAKAKNYDLLRFYLDKHPSLSYTMFPDGTTLIGYAFCQNDKKMIKILEEYCGVSTPIEKYMTPIDIGNLSLIRGHSKRIKSWIDSQDKIVLNRTLGVMTEKKRVKWVKYLLSKDADPCFKLPGGYPVTEIAFRKSWNREKVYKKMFLLMMKHIQESPAISQ